MCVYVRVCVVKGAGGEGDITASAPGSCRMNTDRIHSTRGGSESVLQTSLETRWRNANLRLKSARKKKQNLKTPQRRYSAVGKYSQRFTFHAYFVMLQPDCKMDGL